MRTTLRHPRPGTGRLATLILGLAVVCGVALTSCDTVGDEEGQVVAPAPDEAASRSGRAYGTRWAGPDTPALAEVPVMSQNLYLGGDLFQLLDEDCTSTAANPLALPVCVDQLYDQIVASDFGARAESIADEIARVRPALVGLQEVTTYYVQHPGDQLPDVIDGRPATQATEVAIDFLDLLLRALAERDLDYMAVSINQNSDVELPAFDGGALYDVRYRDADVVLALDDPDVATGATVERTFGALVTIPISGTPQTFVRGYQTVDATVDGFSFTFVNTHLEVGGNAGPVQEAQASELDAAIGAIGGPVVLVGDLNSEADDSGTGSYALLTEALDDVYDRPNLRAKPTCCQAAHLQNSTSELDKRIDFVLYQGFDRVKKAETVLDEPGDRVESEIGSEVRLLWPSDHAGVAALLIYNLRRTRP